MGNNNTSVSRFFVAVIALVLVAAYVAIDGVFCGVACECSGVQTPVQLIMLSNWRGSLRQFENVDHLRQALGLGFQVF